MCWLVYTRFVLHSTHMSRSISSCHTLPAPHCYELFASINIKCRPFDSFAADTSKWQQHLKVMCQIRDIIWRTQRVWLFFVA